MRNRILGARSALRFGLVGVAEAVFAMHPLGGSERLRHGSARTVGDRHIVEAAELEEATSVDGGKVSGDVAVHAANGDQFNIAAPSEVEHGDRIIDPHIGVEQDLSAFHKGESLRVSLPACVPDARGAPATIAQSYSEKARGSMPHLALVVHSYVDEDPRVRRAARAAVAAGWHVSIISLQRDGDPARGELDGAQLYRQPVQRHQGAGISTYVVEYGRFAVLAARELLRIDRERPITVVHANSVPDWLVFAAVPLRRRHRIGLILDLHEASPELFRMRFARSSRSLLTRVAARAMVSLVSFAERRSIAIADWVFVTAPRLRDRLVKIAPRRADAVEVLLNVPETQRFAATTGGDRTWMSDGTLRLVYTGALTPIYEVDVIIRAVALLRAAPAPLPVRLVVAGRGDREQALRELATELGVADAVEFLGRIPFEEVPVLVRGADIALAPTRLDEFTDLSISNKVFEGMASGRLVLGTRLKTLDDLVPETSVARYTSGSAEEAAAVIRRLASDPAERASRIASGLAAIQGGLSWEAAGAAYVQRLTALLPPPADPR